MREQKSYRAQVEQALQSSNATTGALLTELLEEVERLSLENDRLRQTVVKYSRKSSMSSKLKDALYE
ncbi:hypothetical protein [Paenibacillus marinisediminis]